MQQAALHFGWRSDVVRATLAVDLNDISGGFVVEQMQGELVDLFWPKLVR